jgi:hypothetical protein
VLADKVKESREVETVNGGMNIFKDLVAFA